MFDRIKNFISRLFKRKQLPQTMVSSNVPMREDDTVHEILREAEQKGLLQEPTLFVRIKRFFLSLLK